MAPNAIKIFHFIEQSFLTFCILTFKEILLNDLDLEMIALKRLLFFLMPHTCPNFEENILLIVLAYS